MGRCSTRARTRGCCDGPQADPRHDHGTAKLVAKLRSRRRPIRDAAISCSSQFAGRRRTRRRGGFGHLFSVGTKPTRRLFFFPKRKSAEVESAGVGSTSRCTWRWRGEQLRRASRRGGMLMVDPGSTPSPRQSPQLATGCPSNPQSPADMTPPRRCAQGRHRPPAFAAFHPPTRTNATARS